MHRHKKQNEDGGDYLISRVQFALSLNNLVSKVKINTEFDEPYLAGYNEDGTVIYIDRDLPKYLNIKGKRVNVYKYLILHESVEKAMMEKYNMFYEFAHRIATEAEKAAVELAGIDWDAYNTKLDKYMDYSHGEDMKKIPDDLYLLPYKQAQDKQTLAAIRELLKTQPDYSSEQKNNHITKV